MRTLPLLLLALAACGSSPCRDVCHKLASCNALSSTEDQCTQDCEHPVSGRTCDNEDAIASCITQASCDDLTLTSSRLKCPTCQ
jgi:hypothetical protein